MGRGLLPTDVEPITSQVEDLPVDQLRFGYSPTNHRPVSDPAAGPTRSKALNGEQP